MKQPLPLLKSVKLVTILLLAMSLSACDTLFGKEIARLPINALSTPGNEAFREVSLPLKKDDAIAIWSDMDLSYQGEAPVRFQVLILKNGAAFQQAELDPTDKNVSVGEVKTTINGKTKWSFSGKNSEVTIPENATYTFKARLVAADNPTLKITKAELVLKK
ncbi:hypothetical protein [Hymenobacter canadensis]|uniref:Lipoprotein n=1 Tax=Hymenobacter canadensis TaxID=2999067 RepID=A0ABY7LSQ6_9BACT|nr:hypothetical protein [Hymenobacter canadensis]WBA42884.1 hypothetical protein O3303_04810 [Hymenobacter canadensis]